MGDQYIIRYELTLVDGYIHVEDIVLPKSMSFAHVKEVFNSLRVVNDSFDSEELDQVLSRKYILLNSNGVVIL